LFPKSARANLTKSDLDWYLEFAATLERLTEVKLKELGETKGWKENRDMTQTRRCRSDPLRSLHSVAEDLYDVGVIDKTTMRDFDLACLTPVEALGPEAIKQIREKAHMSQATFALALNVTTVLVSKWERGEVRPSGPSLKLLALANSKGVEAIL